MTTSEETNDSLIGFKTRHGVELRGTALRFNRFTAAFELCGSGDLLRLSEALDDFILKLRGRTLYAGRAVVRSLVDTGPAVVCEAELDESSWKDLTFDATMARDGRLGGQFTNFLEEWQKAYQVRPEYKVIIADMQTFFAGLSLWLQQVELGIRAEPEADQARLEQAAADTIAEKVVPCVNTLFEKFEEFAGALPGEIVPAHCGYMRRQLHPLVLCAPFAYRTFHKPLGYAGDYEMVNMILRNAWEGNSLFAKVINKWFLLQPPARAHRNRIAYLAERLRDETLRARRASRAARIFDLGCGSAHEVVRFLHDCPVSDSVAFTLLDFNKETLDYAEASLAAARKVSGRQPELSFVHKSVHQILKESGRPTRSASGEFDFVYCAGLFDYLSDQVCRRLMDTMYGWLAPGGLLVVTNVEPGNPLRNGMEHLLDWYLTYRSSRQMLQLQPRAAHADQVRVLTDPTGVNVFLEVRKPAYG